MKKKLNIEESTELELIFEDGKTLNLVFNVRAMSYLNDIGGMKELLSFGSTPEYCAKIIYITAKAAGNEISLEEARALVSSIKPSVILEIVKEFQESYVAGIDEDTQKKIIAEALKQI